MDKAPDLTSELHLVKNLAADRGRGKPGAAGKPEPEPQPPKKEEKPDPLIPVFEEKARELVRFRRDVEGRLTRLNSEYSAEAQMLSVRVGTLSSSVAKLGEMLETISHMAPPDPKSPDYRTCITDSLHSLEQMRIESLRLSGIVDGSRTGESAAVHEHEQSPADSFTFKRGCIFFLPLALTILGCAVLIAAAFILAWKISM